jgi:hypothetical protein
MPRSRLAVSIAALVLAFATETHALDSQEGAAGNADRALCGSQKSEVAISACSKIIADKDEASDLRAIALRNRGFSLLRPES